MILLSRKDAIKKGKRKYFSGVACKHGHISPRYTKSRSCVTCAIARKKRT